MRTISKYKN